MTGGEARAAFQARLGFPLDPFQARALDAVDAGGSVLVAAPTGAGKTVVAEYALSRALSEGRKAFYTTPLKALSNQKYGDLCRRYGPERVGLLTGDNAVNGDAEVVVMTTEVLRNMIYAGSPLLPRLRYVVLDEVHYLQNPYRGAVWEEVIIHAPPDVDLICLSATVSNAEEVADWIASVRGPTTPVIEEHRPVELHNLYLVGDRTAETLHLVPTFTDGRPNPEAATFDARRRAPSYPGRRSRSRFFTPRRADVVERLDAEVMLPAIYFIFSRAACDDAVRQCLSEGVRLTTTEEREQIRAIAEAKVAALSDEDLRVLDYPSWLAGLEAGLASHHAGLVPPFKEAVEVCFGAALVKVVFATETLSLGINMPARSVVIEKLTKFSGERHEPLTAGEYTQLTGRAGRRGIDPVGYAVVLWSPFVSFGQVAGLASTRTYELRSSFRPTYNMAANLVRRYDPATAHHLLNLSFAQYRADADVVHLEGNLDRVRRSLSEAQARARCARGDVAEYRELETTVRRAAAAGLPAGRIRADGRRRQPRATRGRQIRGTQARLAAARSAGGEEGRRSRPEEAGAQALARHPVAACPDLRAHLRAAERADRLAREASRLERRVQARTESLGRQLDRVLGLLGEWGYVEGWALTPAGQRLSRLYHELDLLVAEALGEGLLDGLSAPALAGLASVFTYEPRGPLPVAPSFPDADAHRRFQAIESLAARLARAEGRAGLPPSRAPDPGFLAIAHAWAAGNRLERVVGEDALSGGDFVRNVKQLVDLLQQLAQVAPLPATREAARQAAAAVFRDVVAASSVLDTE